MRRGENIYKRKDGRWEGRYICRRDKNGKSVYRSVYGHTYTEVKEKLNQKPQRTYENNNCTVSDIAEQWLSSVRLANKLSTYTCYKSLYNNHVFPAVGAVCIDKLDSICIEKLMEEKQNLSGKTRSDILTVIKQILKYAAGSGYTANHLSGTVYVHREKKPLRVFTLQEQKTITDFLLTDQDLRKTGIYLCLNTGLRIGELCALQRKNIDFENAVLHVTSTIQRLENPDEESGTIVVISDPKSSSSIRDIPLPDYLLNIIRKWYINMDPEYYIITGKSKYMEPRTLRWHYDRYIARCGISDVKFHTLRHNFATRCVETGMDIKTLSEILGHSDVSVTLSRYVHSSMELKRLCMNKLSDLF